MENNLKVGDKITWERKFTEEDIEIFGRISGDRGTQHIEPDEQGRLMVQGLLTATLPTKIGGDLNFIAREMKFNFVRPVYAGDTITCEVTILKLDEKNRFWEVVSKWVCKNQNNKEVLTGEALGVVKNHPN